MNSPDERSKPIGKLLGIHIPITQAGVVGIALAEPSVIHHEAFDAEAGGFFCQRYLAGFIDAKFRRFPGVIEHRPRAFTAPSGKNFRPFEPVQDTRRLSNSSVGIAQIERRSLEL